jgi:hypothetical protein
MRSPQPSGPGPYIMSPRDRVVQLDLHVAVCGSQGHAGSIPFYIHTGILALYLRSKYLTNFTVLGVKFEVFTAVTMKSGVFWDVTPCGSCKNRRFGGS